MIVAYVALTFVCTIAVAYAMTGVLPEHPLRGFVLITAECVVALTATFLLGTLFSTLTAGVVALGLQGLAFMGGWLEQVSGFSQSASIVKLGVIASLVMPTESLWRRAAFEMQTPLAGSLSFSPFANVSIPSGVALVYSAGFAVCVAAAALWRMRELDL